MNIMRNYDKTKSDEIIQIPLHRNAANIIFNTVDKYSVSLIFDSKLTAFKNGSDEVQSNHVIEALRNMDHKKKKNWLKEISKIVGGSFFGVFVPGLITSLKPANTISIVIYTAIGFIGMFLIFIGIND